MFQGSMVAIVTPMNSDGSLDIKSFKELLDYHIECKSDGVVVVGTSGEAPTIDFDEHTRRHNLSRIVSSRTQCRNPRARTAIGSGHRSYSRSPGVHI